MMKPTFVPSLRSVFLFFWGLSEVLNIYHEESQIYLISASPGGGGGVGLGFSCQQCRHMVCQEGLGCLLILGTDCLEELEDPFITTLRNNKSVYKPHNIIPVVDNFLPAYVMLHQSRVMGIRLAWSLWLHNYMDI